MASNDGDNTSDLQGAHATFDVNVQGERGIVSPRRTDASRIEETDTYRHAHWSNNVDPVDSNTNSNARSAPVPILASSSSPTRHDGATGLAMVPGGGANTITFSPLPMGRSFPDSQQQQHPPARRLHEFTPSPARSLHVFETAQATEATKARGKGAGSDEGQRESSWRANASVPTGTSLVNFEPQRSHYGWRTGSTGGGSSVAWMMGTSVPESRFSEFEVVYDDGIRKQRTFSLTTEADVNDSE